MNAGGLSDATQPAEHVYFNDNCPVGEFKIKVRFYNKKSGYSSDNFSVEIFNKA